jgi:hypothetical protein
MLVRRHDSGECVTKSVTTGHKTGPACDETGPVFPGSGGRIRTYDLWVMSPASYRAAPPRVGEDHPTRTVTGGANRVVTSQPPPPAGAGAAAPPAALDAASKRLEAASRSASALPCSLKSPVPCAARRRLSASPMSVTAWRMS